MIVDVDEAGRGDQPAGVDGAGRGLAGQAAQGGDVVAANADVADPGGLPVPSTMWALVMSTSNCWA